MATLDTGDGDQTLPSASEIERLDELELNLLAEKILERLRQDLLLERERRGHGPDWPGWRSD